MNAATPLIKQLIHDYPDRQVVVTTMTPTGSARVKTLFGDQVYHVYLPYDLPPLVKRFLRTIDPAILILLETELWPNYLHYCSQRSIPVVLANARLSPQSAKGYTRFSALTRRMLSQIHTVMAQGDADAERFLALGLPKEHLRIPGNIKFDIQFSDDLQEKATELRKAWGQNRFIWIAASTHGGEEDIVLNVFDQLRKQVPDMLLVLVPRHPDRFEEVASLCVDRGYSIVRRTEKKPCHENTNIFLGDTIGELPLFYAASDVVFVGGSLVPVGGHNLLEPAALKKASITGPQMFNFTAVLSVLLDSKGTVQINHQQELLEVMQTLLSEREELTRMGERGYQVVMNNRGAVAKHLALVSDVLA